MFRSILAVVIGALMLGGCATFTEFKDRVNTITPQVEATISVVTATTRRLCGFEPIAATIIGALSGGSLSGPLEVAELICNAVKAQTFAASKKRTRVTVVVRGVRIEGHLIRKQ